METITREVLMTPEMALEMLKINTRNRPLNKSKVLEYESLMKRGMWKYNGEPVIVGKGNVLLDGQHRLAAIIKAKVSQKILIVENIEADVFDTIDVGKARTGGDMLAILDVKDASKVASIIGAYRSLCLKRTNINNSSSVLSKSEVVSIYREMPDFWQDLNKMGGTIYRRLRLFTHSRVGGYIAFLVLEKKHNLEKVYNFFWQLVSSENVENETINVLREKLLKDITGQYRLTPKYKHVCIVKAWNSYISGKTLNTIRYSESEIIPEFL